MATDVTEIDPAIPRFNQACVAVLTGGGFVLDWWPIVPAVAVVLAIGSAAGPRFALFTQIYTRFVGPFRSAFVEMEPAAAPRFAQMLGAVVLGCASVLFLLGLTTAGWVATLAVTALSALAATTRICVGCRIYERTVAS